MMIVQSVTAAFLHPPLAQASRPDRRPAPVARPCRPGRAVACVPPWIAASPPSPPPRRPAARWAATLATRAGTFTCAAGQVDH